MTPRQSQVAELVARGMTNKEIGNALGISVQTVKNYVTALLREAATDNRTEFAVGWVREHQR